MQATARSHGKDCFLRPVCEGNIYGKRSLLSLGFRNNYEQLEASVCLQCGRPGFDLWVRKIPWRRKWQPTPVFLPGESHGWRSLVGYSPRGRKESDTTERLHFHFHFQKPFQEIVILRCQGQTGFRKIRNKLRNIAFGKLSSGHRTGKGQFSFQFQRKAMPKNAQTTTQLRSSHMLVKKCSKFSKSGFSNT